MYVNHSFGHTAFNVYTMNMKKKILTTIIVILILVGGGYIYTKYFTYTPSYQRISQVLFYSQKEISFEIDMNKWNYGKGISSGFPYKMSGISIYFKNSFNEKWRLGDHRYMISFDYEYRPGSEKYCEEEGMGDYCGPQHPYGHPHPDATIIEVQGIPLALPVYLEEEKGLSYPWVTQLVPERDNKMLNRMNFLNNPPMVSDSDQDFRIHPENPYDKKFWEKEVKPALIHALETFEIKDVKKPE